jgi:hypothetical protein
LSWYVGMDLKQIWFWQFLKGGLLEILL